jgi:hypothetical protein
MRRAYVYLWLLFLLALIVTGVALRVAGVIE